MGVASGLLGIFFFSSRRRHTRFDCDWSSDVCSSDLDRVRSLDDGDGVHVRLRERGQRERPRHRVRAARQQLAAAPQEQQDDETDGDELEMLGAHAALPAVSGRYVRRVVRRRRHNRRTPPITSSTGTPMTLPYLTALRVVALVNTSGGGARFLDRMPINASSWAGQSISFSPNTRLSGALRAYRALANAPLPNTTGRPRRAPFVVSRGSGVTSSATRRDRRLSRLNAREGAGNAGVSCTPPARLVDNRGVPVLR